MLSAQQFRQQWLSIVDEEPFVRYEPVMLEGMDIPEEAKTFLLEAGLPVSAAPFLSLEIPKPCPLPSVADRYSLDETFQCYRLLGSDGAGNPLCIEESTGSIVLLDHDDHFSRLFVNHSVAQFAEALLAYNSFARRVIAANGEDAFLEGDIPDEWKRDLAEELSTIDAQAVLPGCFWREELECLNDSPLL